MGLIVQNGDDERKQYAFQFKESLRTFEQENNALHSDALAKALKYYALIHHDLENSAVPSDLLVKRVKYRLLDLIYGNRE